MRKFLVLSAISAACLFAGGANAAVIFSEDFENEAADSVLNFTGFDQFTVSSGIVDYIVENDFGISCQDSGCVDMDGSVTNSDPTSVFTSDAIAFAPGDYTLSFDMSGNQRNSASDTTNVSIAGLLGLQAVTLGGNAPFQTFTYNFSVAVLTVASIVFETDGPSDNIGLILDNVKVETAVIPLPAAAPLMIAGLAGLGFLGRRRRA